MKRLVLWAVLAGFLSVSAVKAQDPNDPNAPARGPGARGKVVVVKDAGGAITSVQIESRRLGTFNVVLDAKGKELGEKMDGKLVAAKGVVTEKDGAKWIIVESYKEIQRPPQNSGRKVPGGEGDKGKK